MTENKHTLCIVDDDIIHHFIIRKLIKNIEIYNKEPLVFSNGEEAITFIKSASQTSYELPDLILLDLNMPIMDGWQFLDEFSSIAPTLLKHIRIYILSSSDNPEDIERAKEYEKICDYLIKPINELQLTSLLRVV